MGPSRGAASAVGGRGVVGSALLSSSPPSLLPFSA